MAENYGSLEGVLDANETLEGEIDSHDEMSGEIQFSGGVGGVKDVQVNNESVVDANKVAHIDLTPYAEKEDVYDKQTIDTALEGKADTDDIPTDLSDLQDDSDHRTVTDEEKTEWSGKADTSDIPTALSQLDNDANYVQDADYVHTDNNFTDEDKAAIGGIPENITDLSDVEVSNIQNGQVLKWDSNQNKFVNANESGGGSGDVADVKVNGTSVVDPVTKEANIDLTDYAKTEDIPTDLADLSDDSTHRLVTDTEKSTWDNKADVSDIPTVNNNTITIQKNGQNVDSFTLNQDSNKAINIAVPTKTSDLQNDSSFITNTVNNLANYYLKTQTYTQAEVDALIDAAINGRFKKVTVLPVTGEPNIIYLVPKATPETSNACDEYIWQDNDWELIGSTNIDLSGYVTDDELTTALQDYLTTSAFNTAIANYYTKTEVGNLLDNKVDKVSGKGLSTYDYDATAKGIVDNVTTNLAGKVDKVNGKGLSTEDYTTTEKNKLAGISTGANKVESSTTNGNIRIDGTETQVYDGSGKVDKVNGKGLSTNDYDNTAKGIVDGVTAALADKVDKETGKGLSTNDFTNEDKALIGQTLGNNTVLTTDKTPFLTRQILNPTGFSGYVREKLVGASYAWNQLVQNGNFADGITSWACIKGSVSVSNGIATVTPSEYDCQIYESFVGRYVVGHKYLVTGRIKTSGTTDIHLRFLRASQRVEQVSTWQTVSMIAIAPADVPSGYQYVWFNDLRTSGWDAWQCTEIQVTDLTLAFGSTIADYLYGLSNNGGITKLRDMGFPIDKYTPYGYGLYSVKTSGKKIVGKNLLGFSNVDFTISNVNFKSQNNTVIANGTASTNISSTSSDYKTNFKFTLNAGTYYFSINSSGVPTVRMTSDDTTVVQGNGTFALTQKTELYIGIYIPANTVFSLRDLKINLTVGSSVTTYEPYSSTTYSLGNDELRGKFDLVNGEIVASGDVKESNGLIDREWTEPINLGSLNWQYSTSYNGFFYASISGKAYGSFNIICSKYPTSTISAVADMGDKVIVGSTSNSNIYIRDTAYSDATTFTNAMNGVYAIVTKSTPTTEQSTPFADPMSLVGATTEEYIDTRDIPCPVGAERQYMGQSEDVVEIPSSPQSDGKRVLTSYKSGDKEQLVWEDLGFAIASIVKSYNIGTSGAKIKMSNGSIFMIGRNSAGVKGVYMVDSQGIPIPMITATGSFTVTANDGIVTIINNSGVAIRITIIEPYVI